MKDMNLYLTQIMTELEIAASLNAILPELAIVLWKI